MGLVKIPPFEDAKRWYVDYEISGIHIALAEIVSDPNQRSRDVKANKLLKELFPTSDVILIQRRYSLDNWGVRTVDEPKEEK